MSLDVKLYFLVDVGREEPEMHIVYESNYTHNCGEMAELAGVYNCVWQPDDHGFEHAEQLIDPLTVGIAAMKKDPEKFKALNPENGWGSYDTFLPWLEKYLAICCEYPKARISACR